MKLYESPDRTRVSGAFQTLRRTHQFLWACLCDAETTYVHYQINSCWIVASGSLLARWVGMLKLHCRLVKIRTILIGCDSFEAYKWFQMKLENKCKISTHFFSRMVKCQPACCMPNDRILFLSRYWCRQLPVTLHLYITELLSETFQEYFWSCVNLSALKDNEDKSLQLFIIVNWKKFKSTSLGSKFDSQLMYS